MADYGVGDYANSTWLLAVSAAHWVCHCGWQLSMKFSTPSKVNEITLRHLWHSLQVSPESLLPHSWRLSNANGTNCDTKKGGLLRTIRQVNLILRLAKKSWWHQSMGGLGDTIKTKGQWGQLDKSWEVSLWLPIEPSRQQLGPDRNDSLCSHNGKLLELSPPPYPANSLRVQNFRVWT